MTNLGLRHPHRPATIIGLSLAAALVVGACGSDSPVGQFEKEQQIEDDMVALVNMGAPGVVVAINEGDHITTMVKGFGDVAADIDLRTDDQLRIGSITKTYTAVVALQLVGEHTLALSDTVERWLPGLVPGGDRITLDQLLNHTSGLADYEVHPAYLEPYMNGDLGHVTTNEELVGFANDLGAEAVPAGTARYSNTNYVLVGLMVEAATGRSLAEQLQQRILDPLELAATSYPSTPELTSPYAHGYMSLDGTTTIDVTGLSPTMAGPGGALVSTAGDVARFYRALMQGEFLEPDLLAVMMRTLPGDGQSMGYGIKAEEQPCGTVWGHGGNFPGYLMLAWSSADGDTQAVVGMNIDPRTMSSAETEITTLVTDALCGPDAGDS